MKKITEKIYMKREQLVSCNCAGHKMIISYDYDENSGIEKYWNPLMNLSIWKLERENSPRWKEKLRHIWYIITRGYPWEDSIVLGYDELLELRDGVNKTISFYEESMEKYMELTEKETKPKSMSCFAEDDK